MCWINKSTREVISIQLTGMFQPPSATTLNAEGGVGPAPLTCPSKPHPHTHTHICTRPYPPPTYLRQTEQAIFLHITSMRNIISIWPLGTRACFAPNTASAHLVCLAGSGETRPIHAPEKPTTHNRFVFHFILLLLTFLLFFFFFPCASPGSVKSNWPHAAAVKVSLFISL